MFGTLAFTLPTKKGRCLFTSFDSSRTIGGDEVLTLTVWLEKHMVTGEEAVLKCIDLSKLNCNLLPHKAWFRIRLDHRCERRSGMRRIGGSAPASNHSTPLQAWPTKIPRTASIAHQPWISSASRYHFIKAGSFPKLNGSNPKSPETQFTH